VEQIKGKYLLERPLGRGGMAEVFLGRTIGAAGFSHPVAIKRILAGCSADARQRILRHPQLILLDLNLPKVTGLDVLRRINRISSLSVHLSLITLDRELARRLEPRAPTPDARVRALGRLRANDIETGINVMPVLPGITDHPEQLDHLVQTVAANGASYVNACALRLRSSARARYLPFIEQEFPHLAGRYQATFAYDHHVSANYSTALRETMQALCEKHGVGYGHFSRSGRSERHSEIAEQRFAGDQLVFELESSS